MLRRKRERMNPEAFGQIGRAFRGAHVAFAIALLVCAAMGTILLQPPLPRLVWNRSPSSPVGLYLVRGKRAPRRGEFAIAWPPPAAERLAARRGYLPEGVPFVKPVAAVAGATVCAQGDWIHIDGRRAARRASQDRAGRPLRGWSGCVRLKSGELFLLSANAPGAYDGRYFGVTRARDVIGSARLVWRS